MLVNGGTVVGTFARVRFCVRLCMFCVHIICEYHRKLYTYYYYSIQHSISMFVFFWSAALLYALCCLFAAEFVCARSWLNAQILFYDQPHFSVYDRLILQMTFSHECARNASCQLRVYLGARLYVCWRRWPRVTKTTARTKALATRDGKININAHAHALERAAELLYVTCCARAHSDQDRPRAPPLCLSFPWIRKTQCHTDRA